MKRIIDGKRIGLRLGVLFLAFVGLLVEAVAAEVNLYTDRQAVFLRPVLEAFEAETDVKVNVLFAKKGLLERMQAEGNSSPADVVMAVDVGRLDDFVAAGLIAEHDDEVLRAAVPAKLRSDFWVAVTQRARLLYVRKGVDIRSYDDLADPANRQSVCIRSGKHTYNIALIADMISRLGEAGAKQWLIGVRDNLARKPQGKDRTQINDVVAGKCIVGVANSYYYFQLLKKNRQPLIDNVDVVVPPQVHINVTGVALAKHAPNRDNGLRLMQFLTSKQGQQLYAQENSEFPVRTDIDFPPALAPYKEALAQAAALADVARYRAAASRLVEEVGFDR